MRRYYRYILVFLIFIIVYELYLILSFKYVDIQKDSMITNIQKDIEDKKYELNQKKDYFAYINTLAYKDKVAKMSQNRKNPGEDVVYIVSKDEVEEYKKINPQEQMFATETIRSPTYGMSNPQKWIYVVFKKDIRD